MKIRSPLGMLTVLAILAVLLANPAPSGAVVSGTNGRIAFVSDRSGTRQIYVMRSDGSAAIQLTTSGNNWDPAYSGDGVAIAFISDRDGSPELYTMDADGANQTRVTSNTMTESHPSWAPNNSAIAFAGLSGTDSDIWAIGPRGRGLVDLTPDPVAFDANPAWSPGGNNIAFDSTNRGGDTGTNVWTMGKTGTNLKKLTTTGKDSNPNYAPDNKTLAFESARDVFVPGWSVFTSIQKPVGIAVTTDRILVTQWNTDKVKSIDGSGTVTNFATLPPTGLSIERYLAVSSGLGGFPPGYVYATVGANVYQITPDGLTVTLFCSITTANSGETGISFDAVGTFGYDMILTDRSGPVWTCDSAGVATQIGDFQRQVEAPLVAPTSFVPYGGKILAGSEFGNGLYVLNDNGNGSTLVGPWTGAEGPILIPGTACNFGTSGGSYFVAMKDDPNSQGSKGEIVRFGAGNFTGLGGDILVPSETDPVGTGIGRFHSDGTTVSSSLFWAPVGTTGDLEGSAFAPCPSGGGAKRLAVPNDAGGPHEIYSMAAKDGSGQTRLTINETDDSRPAWSPDGKNIVFQSDRDDPNQPGCEGSGTCKYDVYTMKADGSSQVNISNNVTADDVATDWQSVSYPGGIYDDFFSPTTEKPTLGGTVLWENYGTDSEGHTVTDNSGMGLFDSLVIPPGGFFQRQFTAASKYPFYCTVHTFMTGTVNVPMTAAPKTGNLTTVFTITWATIAPAVPYRYDVQIKRPGSSDFVDWVTNSTLKAKSFTADAGTGTYSFQARIRNTSNGFAATYSAPATITVNP